jgi:dipeptidyl aminopeptidase/acylaminoacyl peptidase
MPPGLPPDDDPASAREHAASVRRRAGKVARSLIWTLIVGGTLAYTAALGALAVSQRSVLYNLSDDGRLAAAGGLAVPDSQRLTLTADDGVELAAWYRPPRRPNGKLHLFLHGQGGQLVIQTGRWRRIGDLGDGVLALSYRGYPGSKGTPDEAGIHKDARAAWDWLARRYDPQRIVIHGHSLGSGVAVRLAASVGAHPAAVVLEAPFTAAVDVAADRFPVFPVYWLMLDQFRSRDWIGQVASPVLIVHGARDTVIPLAHARHLYHMVRTPKELVVVPDGDHNTLVRDGLYDHVSRFLTANATTGRTGGSK